MIHRLNQMYELSFKGIRRKQTKDALRKTENNYRQIIEILQEGIWMIDKNAVTIFVNPAMPKMLGYTQEEMIGKRLFSFMDERGIKLAKHLLERREQGIREQHDFEFLKKDGSRIYVTMNASPINDNNGKYIGAVAGVIDVTERRIEEEEEKKIHSQNMIKMLDEERYKIAEDLHDGIGQTVLAAKLNLNIYKNDPRKNYDRLEKALQLINDVSREMRDICTNIYPGILGEGGLEAAIHTNVQNTLELCGIKTNLNIKLKKKLPHILEINIFRIIQEITANTIKHSNAGTFLLDLHHEQEYLRIICEDNGRGFKEKKIKNKIQGFGLSNIRHRVDSLGGVLDIDSMSGKGTKIIISIKDK